jgi:DNA-binding SARP family transcriptional activator
MTMTPSTKPRRGASRQAHQAPPAKLAALAATPAHGERPPSRGPTLHLLLSGRPAWRESPRAAPIALAARDAALLAWLAIEGATTRVRLAALLWPDSAPEAARNTLRQRLFQLRKQLGRDVATGPTVLALADGIEHDLADADTVLGSDPHDHSTEFAAWLARQRALRLERARQRLIEVADKAEQARDWPAALEATQQLLALDPLREDAHRRLMRVHYLAGDRAAALQAFDACERTLKDEVGTRPDAQTMALLAQVQAGAADAQRAGPRGVPASVLRPPRLIGRDGEWDVLLQGWNTGGISLLVGEPGMGKSRLVGDLGLRLGNAVATASARPGDDAVPYVVLARLLRVLLARAKEPLPPRHLRELARLLPELGDAPPPDTARPLALRDALDAALAASGVTGVLVDDLHFVDAATVEALQHLCATASALPWVLAYRPGELGSAAQGLVSECLRETRTQEVKLAPLSTAAVADLVDSLGIAELEGTSLAPSLVRHTGGNPLYLLETIKGLLLQGGPATASSALSARVSTATAMKEALPTARSVLQLISQRLASLSPGALKLARCAAVAGQDFSTALAVQVLGASPLDLADAWSELEAAQVLCDAAFAHDLIHEAARASVPPALARRLHALVAEALVARQAPAARIADHFAASDMQEAAVPHLLEAGQQAARALRPREALAAHMQAAEVLQAQGREAEAFRALLSLLELVYSPRTEDVLAVLDRLGDLAQGPAERAQVAERRADMLSRSGDFIGAGQIAQAALADLDSAHPALAARLLCAVAAADIAKGEHDRAVERMHRANDLAARSGDEEAEATVAGYLGSVLDHAHRYAEAYLAHRRALELDRRRGRAIEIIATAANIAGNRSQLGYIDTSLEMVHECYRVAGEASVDLSAQWPTLYVSHAYALLYLGDYTQSLRRYEDAQGVIERYMPSWLPGLQNQLATLWMHLGQWARARRAVESALLADGGLPRYRARALLLRDEIAAALRSPSAASTTTELQAFDAGTLRAVQHPVGLRRTLALPAEAGYELACAMRTDAQMRQMPNLVMEAEARCAVTAARCGRHAQAATHAREALARLREVTPTNLYRGEIWRDAAEGLAATAPHERDAVLRTAAAWIHATARERVPAEFRDSFLHRNPVNRELLTLASRVRHLPD